MPQVETYTSSSESDLDSPVLPISRLRAPPQAPNAPLVPLAPSWRQWRAKKVSPQHPRRRSTNGATHGIFEHVVQPVAPEYQAAVNNSINWAPLFTSVRISHHELGW